MLNNTTNTNATKNTKNTETTKNEEVKVPTLREKVDELIKIVRADLRGDGDEIVEIENTIVRYLREYVEWKEEPIPDLQMELKTKTNIGKATYCVGCNKFMDCNIRKQYSKCLITTCKWKRG